MPNYNIYIFTKAGNKSRYATSEEDALTIMDGYYNNEKRYTKKIRVKCESSGVIVVVPVDNIDFIQCQKMSGK